MPCSVKIILPFTCSEVAGYIKRQTEYQRFGIPFAFPAKNDKSEPVTHWEYPFGVGVRICTICPYGIIMTKAESRIESGFLKI